MTSTTTAAAYRGMGEHLPELRADLQRQRQFRVQQLLALAIMASRKPMPAPEESRDDVLTKVGAAARAALADIDLALRRIELGTYGTCQRCAAAIPLERLRVLPMVALCMPCQHDQDHGHTPP